MRVELLWFRGCPNYQAAERLIRDRLAVLGLAANVRRIEIRDELMGTRYRFPGSPTIRVNGSDVQPSWMPCTDCRPGCRVYPTETGLRGLPPVEWVDAALLRAAWGASHASVRAARSVEMTGTGNRLD